MLDRRAEWVNAADFRVVREFPACPSVEAILNYANWVAERHCGFCAKQNIWNLRRVL
jgi:hypothetical protein